MNEVESPLGACKRQGFLILEQFFNPRDLGSLRQKAELVYRGWDKFGSSARKEISSPDAKTDAEPVREINWPRNAWQILEAEPAYTKLKSCIETLHNRPYRLIHVNSLLKPAFHGSAVAPHQDTGYNTTALNEPLTAWIPMVDVSEQNGAIYYYSGSHRLGQLEHEMENRVHWVPNEKIETLGLSEPTTVSGEAGLISIHDSRILHGSHENISDSERLSLSIRFEAIK